MRQRNPWSSTILKGCMLSATQQTISALPRDIQHEVLRKNKDSYRVSALVCWRCEYKTLPFPVCLNAAMIEPSFRSPRVARAEAMLTFASKAPSTVSAPQHTVAWCLRLLVDFQSVVSR